MAKRYKNIPNRLQAFIRKQPIFFVGTAASEGRVNVSPKGMDSLRILDPNRVVWLNVTGSGNETAAHLLQQNRMTIMFCAFEGAPMILRLYGNAKIIHPGDPEWQELADYFPKIPGQRQIFDVHIDLVQTSCGMAVPILEYKGEREALNQWADDKGEQGIREYWEEKNKVSLDSLPTDL